MATIPQIRSEQSLLSESEYPTLTGHASTQSALQNRPQIRSTKGRTTSQRERRNQTLPQEAADVIAGCFSKSYVRERKVQDALRKERRAQELRRKKAIESLNDKDALKARLTKTKMCSSVQNGESCPHGKSCRFAHSADELVVPLCAFDHDCRFIEINEEGSVSNSSGTRVCEHMHTGETKEQHAGRLGRQSPQASTPPKPKAPTMVPRQLQIKPKVDADQPIPPPPPPLFPVASAPRDVTILRVPIELATQAMELALRNGGRDIRVEITPSK